MDSTLRRLFPGILLIVLGLLFLVFNLTDINIGGLWPLVLLGPGIYFFILYFFMDRKNFGLLMPATVLTVIGLLFLYCEYTDWQTMQDLWPLFLLAPGIGFFLMYFFGKKERGFLVPGSILSVLGVLFLLKLEDSGIFWPVVLILAGLLLLFGRAPRPSVRTGVNEHPSTTA